MAIKWFELGLELLDDSQARQLDIIKANNHDDVIKCCQDMFKYWLDTDPTASYNKLVNSLKAPGIEMDTVAVKLENMFSA